MDGYPTKEQIEDRLEVSYQLALERVRKEDVRRYGTGCVTPLPSTQIEQDWRYVSNRMDEVIRRKRNLLDPQLVVEFEELMELIAKFTLVCSAIARGLMGPAEPEFNQNPNTIYPTKLQDLNMDSYGNPLVCSGCANSAAQNPFPGRPSGDRPCLFCVRNVRRQKWCADHTNQCHSTRMDSTEFPKDIECQHPAHGFWYDGSRPVSNPMDCYSSVDMREQTQRWMEARETK